MPARGFAGNHTGAPGPYSGGPEKASAGNSPTKEGRMVRNDGPSDHESLLDFYFGEPTSTHKESNLPFWSKW